VLVAVLMMAWYVAAKTARDSLFLGVFPKEDLPAAVGAGAAFSILMAYGSSLILRRMGPSRVIPLGFFLSAVVHLIQWILLPQMPRPISAFVYVYVVAFGPVLLSGFWTLANESFDSREARRHFGHIAACGTVGAIIGGLLAERVAVLSSTSDILLLMAALQVVAGIALVRFVGSATIVPEEEPHSFPEIISSAPYLAGLAAFVLLTSMSAAALDYLFKAGAVTQFGRGLNLTRFFSLFNAVTAGLTFVLQAGLSPLWLRRFGPGGTVGALPSAVTVVSVASMVLPNPLLVTLARAVEQLLRGSLFRSGYELFYTPMPTAEKRAIKPVIDIGVDRLGEGLASGAIKLLLLTLPAGRFASVVLLGTAATSAIAAWLAFRLDRSYVMVLERGLADHAVQIEIEDTQDALTRSVVMDSSSVTVLGMASGITTGVVSTPLVANDPVLLRLAGLRSAEASRVRKAIAQPGKWEPVIVAQMIELLARDDVARYANEALRAYLPSAAGQLADRLADPSTDAKIRRRIPRLLATSKNPLAWDALFRQLADASFEIRYRCGRALAEIGERHPEFHPAAEVIFLAVGRELADQTPAAGPDEHSKHRLSHLANLLGLVLPPQSVHLAFRALQTDDPNLRATAIEYLDSVLPHALRRQIAALFDVPQHPVRDVGVPAEQALSTLIEAMPSIQARLDKLGVDLHPPPSHDD
jgi:hypothetical protein